MPNPLFSTYRTGENRVTSSMLAVFERIELSLVERILGAVAEEANLSLVTFANQPPGGVTTVADASISADFRYLFEVKIRDETIRPSQIRGHLEQLSGTHADERLFVITTDAAKPRALDGIDDVRIHWTNFRRISEAIETILGDPHDYIGERTAFLLRELQALFRHEGLLDFDDTVVVAARWAYREYLTRSAYICQPERSFQAAIRHLGFYADGEIKQEIAAIEYVEDLVEFSRGEAARRRASGDILQQRVAAVIEESLDRGDRAEGQPYKVFLLSGPTDAATIRLPHPIVNDTTASSGRGWGWVLGQRYTRLDRLAAAPETTSGIG